MEKRDQKQGSSSSACRGGSAIALSLISASCVVLSVTTLGLWIHASDEITQLKTRQKTLEQIVETLSNKLVPEAELDFHSLYKRNIEEDKSQSETESILSQLSLGDLSHLRGPAGRDGRDGRDGRSCDPADCHSAAAAADDSDLQQILGLLSNKTTVAPTITPDSREAEFNQAEMLAAFNQTIAHGLLRSIQRTNAKLEELEESLGSTDTGKTSGLPPTTETPVSSSVSSGGSTYTRWGRTSCSNASELIYRGFAAGQHYNQPGGASNYQCLPLEPEYNSYLAGDTGNYIYGAEYETGSNLFGRNMQDQNVPCARCFTPQRSATIMIPARRSCPDNSWTKEYEGYLMSGLYSHARAYNYACMDVDPESVPGLHGDTDGALFYFVQGSCSSLGRCPPYIQGAELTCVVCSK